jgi:membrane-associated protein
MEFLTQFADIVLHLDTHLALLLQQYGSWVYGILFLIVFCETGLVVTPFLPGDSLLFVAGALAASGVATGVTTGAATGVVTGAGAGGLDIGVLIAVLLAAAVIGDNTNYWIGRWAGNRIVRWNSRVVNRAALDRTHAFYKHHGGKTMTLARFIPLVRTFAPFVAGMARMSYPRFFGFDLIGGIVWVVSLCMAGYWFGNLAVVRNNLSAVILAIVAISLTPVLFGWVKHKLKS